MDLSAVVVSGGIIVTAIGVLYGIWRSTHNDKHAEHVAAAENSVGMAGLVIAGWQNLVAEGRVTLTAVTAERDQLRVDLDACIERARRARRARSDH